MRPGEYSPGRINGQDVIVAQAKVLFGFLDKLEARYTAAQA